MNDVRALRVFYRRADVTWVIYAISGIKGDRGPIRLRQHQQLFLLSLFQHINMNSIGSYAQRR